MCRKCHGENDRASRFCWYCGAPLRGARPASGAQAVALDVTARVAKWLVFLAVLAAVVFGVYYALDRYVWPALDRDVPANVAATTSTAPRTTTTTLIPREDRVVPAGADRYATAIAISKMGFPDGAPAVVLVRGDDYGQGLSAGPLAAAYGGPVLLMPPGGLREDLSTELQRLAPTKIFLIALPRSRTLQNQLESLLEEVEVTRLAGDDVYETAALVAGEVQAKLGSISKVVLAPSDSFLEALVTWPLASANGWPILLAPTEGELPYATRQAIEKLDVTSALVVGLGTELELSDVESQAGSNSFDTAALVVKYAADHGCDFTHVAITTGDNFPEAMVTASYLALDKGILVPATDGRPPASLMSVLDGNLDDVRTLDIIALPALAKEMATNQSTTPTTENSGASTATTEPDATGTGAPSSTTTERNTPEPSAGGF